MALTGINSQDRLVQQTFASHLERALGWDSVYAHNAETFGPGSMLGRVSERDVVLVRDLRTALARLNPEIPEAAREQAVENLTRLDSARSLIQHNRDFHTSIRTGVPVEWRDQGGQMRYSRARVIDFRDASSNRFLAARELRIQGACAPRITTGAPTWCASSTAFPSPSSS